ncbi:DUF3298 and DUF4163 domain-containing protein [Chitinophaga rhizophila]|uniref:DUF3298 and DUF4163 domain-containing protein n=1 Tax=Chitinophaga rhizophila TaxID=2866212 RepID=A0ABS7GG62_9BACT|nr:DUF3298 and DUF4163 domain-containing protein [Chitinophaga rhizophila]MBW8686235.1 DUF3298 and DUF4163 domain-containing protein [Chitinophaga rhizophila]
MRTILLFAITCCVLVSCSTKTKQSSQAAKAPDPTKTPFYYLHLKGKIGTEPITMDLIKAGPWVFRGYYSYDKIGEPIMIWGTPEGDKVIVSENTDPNEERLFSGKLDSLGGFKGTWRGKGTSYPFELKPSLENAVSLDVLYGSDSLPLYPGNPNTPIGQATNCILWPAASTDASVADFIRKNITDGKPITDPVKFLKRDIDSFLATYKVTGKDLDTAEGIPAAASWGADADMKVVWNNYPLLVLEYFSYEFTGGAHGNYGAHYQVLDLEKKKVLKPEDILKPEYKEALIPELEKSIRKIYNIEPGRRLETMLLVKEIEPNDNFLVTDKGIGFSYTPYEIGPYAMGQITLFIPFKDIKKLLK